MVKPYVEELVEAESEDGLVLQGVVIRPAAGPVKLLPVVWVHGFTGRYYEPHAVRIGRGLAERGYVFVAGNNRGNNVGATVRRKGGESLLAGAIWEQVDESPNDVAGWIGFAVGLGFRRVALLGHSLGAQKVAFYQTQRQDPRVAGLILASGALRRRPQAPELLAEAERLVAEGRGQELLPGAAMPGAVTTVSAQTFLSRARVAFDPALVRCPLLAFLGTNEPQIAAPEDLEALRRRATVAPRVDVRLIEGADHIYTGCEAQVVATIADWVDTLA